MESLDKFFSVNLTFERYQNYHYFVKSRLRMEPKTMRDQLPSSRIGEEEQIADETKLLKITSSELKLNNTSNENLKVQLGLNKYSEYS